MYIHRKGGKLFSSFRVSMEAGMEACIAIADRANKRGENCKC